MLGSGAFASDFSDEQALTTTARASAEAMQTRRSDIGGAVMAAPDGSARPAPPMSFIVAPSSHPLAPARDSSSIVRDRGTRSPQPDTPRSRRRCPRASRRSAARAHARSTGPSSEVEIADGAEDGLERSGRRRRAPRCLDTAEGSHVYSRCRTWSERSRADGHEPAPQAFDAVARRSWPMAGLRSRGFAVREGVLGRSRARQLSGSPRPRAKRRWSLRVPYVAAPTRAARG